MDLIFAEQPYLANVYPGKTRDIGIIFEIRDAQIEYFHLGVSPIFRETYILGRGIETKQRKCRGSRSRRRRAGKRKIADERISYHRCMYRSVEYAREAVRKDVLARRTIPDSAEHCLHCGNCYEHCPVSAVKDYEVKEYVGRTSDKADPERTMDNTRGQSMKKLKINMGEYGHDTHRNVPGKLSAKCI